MPTIVFLATAWGPKAGGINTFNMDIAKTFGERDATIGAVSRAAAMLEPEYALRPKAMERTMQKVRATRSRLAF